jgi:EAL domain-containing protein (putative c-di-GMP-specific phosphodiesterase class I)
LQGFLFAKPAPAKSIDRLLQSRPRASGEALTA